MGEGAVAVEKLFVKRTCFCAKKRHESVCVAEPVIFAHRCKHTDRRVYARGLCVNCYTTSRRRANMKPGRPRSGATRYHLKRRYGITQERYDELNVLQGGLCAICKRTCVTGRSLAVDHDHETMEVRGLLCMRCNRGIAMLREDPVVLKNAAEYMERACLNAAAYMEKFCSDTSTNEGEG